jgi:flavorubredoxin
MVGAPTYEGGLFPDMKTVLEMAGRQAYLQSKNRCFGSNALGGRRRKRITLLAEKLKWESLGSLIFQGSTQLR